MRGLLAATETPIFRGCRSQIPDWSKSCASARRRRSSYKERFPVRRWSASTPGVGLATLRRKGRCGLCGSIARSMPPVLVSTKSTLSPRGAAVCRLENSAFAVGLEDVPHRGGIHDARIARIDDELAIMCVSRSPAYDHVFPPFGRLVDAVAGVKVAADVRLTGTCIDDVRVRGRDRERADRIRDAWNLTVGDVRPAQPVIGALPNAALNATEIEEIRLVRHAGNRDRAAADVRPDAAPLQLADELL